MLTDIDFYVNDYGGEAYSQWGEKGLKKLLRRAERDVWCVCSDRASGAFGGKISDEGDALILKTAVCVQADFLASVSENENSVSDAESSVSGGENMTGESSANAVISSVKLGDFSVNYDYISTAAESGDSESSENGSGPGTDEYARGKICEEALLILDKGGLLYRGGVRV